MQLYKVLAPLWRIKQNSFQMQGGHGIKGTNFLSPVMPKSLYSSSVINCRIQDQSVNQSWTTIDQLDMNTELAYVLLLLAFANNHDFMIGDVGYSCNDCFCSFVFHFFKEYFVNFLLNFNLNFNSKTNKQRKKPVPQKQN